MGKSFRLPNGYGSIYKLSGNRRRPYAVAKTFGWDENGKQIKKIIDYATTKKEGLEILLEYNKDPYDFDKRKITVDEVYELTVEKLTKIYENKQMSKSNYNRLQSSYINYCKEKIGKMPITKVEYIQMQNLIDNCNYGHTTKGYIKTILEKIFSYGKLDLGIKELDLQLTQKLEIGTKKISNMHKSITDEEINMLWDLYQANPSSDLETIFIMIYTGLRPQELIDIETININIEEQYMIGGCKTEAGKNRIIPIHNKILPFIKKRIDGEYLILINGRKSNYKDINKLWKKVMELLNLEHLPYDSRHTMATRLDEYKITHPNSQIDDLTIKLIMGHAITDITQKVYIHRNAKYLVDAVNLIY